MIVQRIASALRRQDWFTVVLEVLIVVVGILIALQVENWNEARKDRADAADWRRQILADLEQTHWALASRGLYSTQALAFGERSLELITDDGPLDDDAAWDLVLGAFQAGQIWPYRLTGTAFRQAQSAGGLGLVAEPDVVVTLAYLYDVTAHDYELVSGGLPRYRDAIRERLPWAIQSHIWDAECQLSKLEVDQADYRFELVRCEPPGDRELIQAAALALRDDTELQDLLRGRLSQLKVSEASIGRILERVDNAMRALRDSR